MIATKAETFRWLNYSKITGFVLSLDDGTKLPGIINVDLSELDRSLKNEIEQLETSYAVWDAASQQMTFGPWFSPIDKAEIKAAILLAVASEAVS